MHTIDHNPPVGRIRKFAYSPNVGDMVESLGVIPLIGRERDLEVVEGLLADGERLITLTGPGGVGKTSLSRRVQQGWVAEGGAAWFVACEQWEDPSSLLEFVADQIGGGAGDAATQISSRFATGDALLVLDNLEHLVVAGASIATLVAMDERIRIVCTSRLALRVRGERVHEVRPLGAAALVMLADRIESAGSPRPTADDPLLDELCDLVDRLPLGIELAAARVPVFGLRGLTVMLRDDTASLDRSSNAVDPRHRSLLGTVAESHALIDDPLAETLYRRLGVMSGSFGLALASGLLDDAPPGAAAQALARLVELHLVTRVGDEPSFRMLVVVREHARRLLAGVGETALTEQRIIDWARRIAHRRDPRDGDMTDDEHRAWMAVVTTEAAAIQSALFIARREGQRDALRSLVGDLRPYWISVGAVREGYGWAETAARLHFDDLAATAELCFHASALADFSHGADVAMQWVERGAPAAEQSGERYFAARLAETGGVLLAAQGRLDEAEATLRRGLALFAELGLESFEWSTMAEIANVAAVRGDLDGAERLYAEIVEPFESAGLDRLANVIRGYWADVARRNGHLSLALELLDRAERGLAGDAMLADYPVAFRAHVFNDLGKYDHARYLAEPLLERSVAQGSTTVEAHTLAALARALHHLDQREGSVDLVHRCVDAFALIGSDAGLIDAVELAAECAAPGRSRTSLIAAANALRDRIGARRPPTALARLSGAELVPAVGATVSEVHQWIAEGSSVRASTGDDPALGVSAGPDRSRARGAPARRRRIQRPRCRCAAVHLGTHGAGPCCAHVHQARRRESHRSRVCSSATRCARLKECYGSSSTRSDSAASPKNMRPLSLRSRSRVIIPRSSPVMSNVGVTRIVDNGRPVAASAVSSR